MDVAVHLPASRVRVNAFDEVAETLRCGLKALAATGYTLPDRTIVLGPHLLSWSARSDDRLILYNFEQRDSPALDASVLDTFRRHEVWDYSASNVAWLAERGVRARHVPLGYVPELKRIEHIRPEIDVLFYGLVNDRRRRILDSLRAAKINVCTIDNCYGPVRDHFISRSRVVLNAHFYDTGIFEMVRCSYLFANEICVISEESVDVPPELAQAVPLVPRERLASACARLIDNPDEARLWAALAHKAFRVCDEVDILRKAIDGSRP